MTMNNEAENLDRNMAGVTGDLLSTGMMGANEGEVPLASDQVTQDSGKTKPRKKAAAKTADRYPNIGNGVAMTKSVTVSNGAMMACRFVDAMAYMMANDDAPDFKKSMIDIKTVQGRTARKDVQAADAEDKKDTTLYRGDEATLPEGMDSVSIVFELSVRNAVFRPHSISGQGYRRLRQNGFFDRIVEVSRDVFREIAENVFSGKWGWRNEEESSSSSVMVTTVGGMRIRDADTLAGQMFDAFVGHPVHLQVHGVFLLGTGAGGTPVFPSQIMAVKEDKRFFEVNTADGQSVPALRGVKIGNRLREMDVWYRRYPEYQVRLPVEPLGYSMWLNEVLRGEDESLTHYMNQIMGDHADEALSDEAVMRFVCGNALFGFLITVKK